MISNQDGISSPRLPPRLILIVLAGIGPASLNIFLPSMPGLMSFYDTDYSTAQLTLTLYLVGLGVAQLAYGPLSDKFGRRPVVIIGLAIFIFGSAVCCISPSIEVLLAGRFLQAIGGCSGIVISRAIIRDVFNRERAAKALAYVTMAMVVAPLIAPSVGGFLDVYYGWQASFALLVIFGVVILVSCIFTLNETRAPNSANIASNKIWVGIGELLSRRRFYGYSLQVAFNSGVFYAFIAGAPYIMIELLGQSANEYGLWFVFSAGLYMCGNLAAARYTEQIGSDRMIAIGTAISLLGSAIIAVVFFGGLVTPLALFGSMGIVAFGNGINIPNGVSGAVSVIPNRSGAASGLSGFAQMVVGATVSYMVGSCLADSSAPLVMAMVICALIARLSFDWAMRGQ